MLILLCLTPWAAAQSDLKALERELSTHPEDARLWRRLGEEERRGAAISLAQRLLVAHRSCLEGWEALARLAVNSGDYPQAVGAWERAAELAHAAEDWDDEYLAVGRLFQLHACVGATQAAMQALRRYRDARKRAGKSTERADALLASSAREKALAHLGPRDRYRTLAREARERGDAAGERGALLKLVWRLAQGRTEAEFREGVEAGRRVLELDPGIGVGAAQASDDHNGCGRMTLELALLVRDPEERAELLDEALALAQESVELMKKHAGIPGRDALRNHCLLAHVYEARGDAGKARRHFEEEFALVRRQREEVAAGRLRGDPTERALRVFDGEVHHIYEDFGLFKARGTFDGHPDLEAALRVTEEGRVGALAELYGLRGRKSPAWMQQELPLAALEKEAEAARTVVLVYVVGSHAAGLITVGGSGLRFAPLADVHAIDAVVRRFTDTVLALQSSRKQIEEAGREAFDVLLAPAWESCRGAQRLVVVGLDRWGHAPLGALVAPGKDSLEERYLGARTQIVSAPTLGCLAQKGVGAARGPALAVGFSGGADYDQDLARHFGADRLRPLEAAPREAALVAKLLGGRALVGEKATCTAVRAAARSASVLHFACHAQVDSENATRSALLLAPTADDDGFLTLSEILGLRLDARLVVLSACSGASGERFQGEGIRGMSRCFLVCGARCVLASLAPVDDQASPLFLEALARSVAKGDSVPASVQAARRAMLAHRFSAHPALWAPFTLFGQGAALLR